MGNPSIDSSQWTLETLRLYMLAIIEANDARYLERFESSQVAMQAALAAADRAVIKSEVATEKRFESVNEFRATLSDQQRNFMPRPEVELLLKGLDDKIEVNTLAVAASTNQRAGLKNGWSYLVAALGVIGLVSGILISIFK